MPSRSLVDLHCHLVPDVDDGARSLDEAIDHLGSFREQDILTVVTTPHLSSSHTRSEWRDRIDAQFARLAERAAADCPEVELSCSYEIRLDDPDADLGDPPLGLGDGGALLVEFPMLVLPAYPDRMLAIVREAGWTPVLAHPERYAGLERAYDWIPRWRDSGAVMCVNAGSLWGEYGPEAERVTRRMLTAGHIDCLASDHHARPGRSTTVREAWSYLVEAGLQEHADLLIGSNPRAVLEGQSLVQVPPCEIPNGWIDRLKRFVRGGSPGG